MMFVLTCTGEGKAPLARSRKSVRFEMWRMAANAAAVSNSSLGGAVTCLGGYLAFAWWDIVALRVRR
jgi:hypothetical protein